MAALGVSGAASSLDLILEALNLHERCETVLLMVTPSKVNQRKYRVNIFGEGSVRHLGSATITEAALWILKSKEGHRNISIMLTRKYISLRKMLSNRQVMLDLMKTLNGKYCSDRRWKTDMRKTFKRLEKHREERDVIDLRKLCRKQKIHMQQRQLQEPEAHERLKVWHKELAQLRKNAKYEKRKIEKLLQELKRRVQKELKRKKRVVFYQRSGKAYRNRVSAVPEAADQESSSNPSQAQAAEIHTSTTQEPESKSSEVFATAQTSLTNLELNTLIDRIKSADTPSDDDLMCFFKYAELHKFSLYIRPEPAAPNEPARAPSKKQPTGDRLAFLDSRYRVECFKQSNNYVGYITLTFEVLHRKLLEHVQLMPSIQVVEDVLNIMPFPETAQLVLRLLSLEGYYDQFGQLLFDLYTKHKRP